MADLRPDLGWGSAGFAVAVAAVPLGPVYAALEKGVFMSTDQGANWSAVVDGLGDMMDRVRCLAIDPNSADVIYGGTYGTGVFRTENGGANWHRSSTGLRGAHTTAVRVAFSYPDTIYAGGAGGFHRSKNGGTVWEYSPFTDIWTTPYAASVTTLVESKVTSGRLYASSNAGVLISTNHGATWRWLTPWLPGPNTGTGSVACISVAPGDTLYAGSHGGVMFKSCDAGATWQTIRDPGISSATGDVTTIAVTPNSSSVIYAGLGMGPGGELGVLKSTDAGVTWLSSSTGLPAATGISEIAVDPTVTSTVYAATHGEGVYKSTDAGNTWFPINSGIEVLRWVRAIGLTGDIPPALYAGGLYNNRIYTSADGGDSWIPAGDNPDPAGWGVVDIAVDPLRNYRVHIGTDGNGVLTKDFVATPDMALSSDSLYFPEQPVGQTSSQAVVIRNRGSAVLAVAGISSSSTEFAASPSVFSLAPRDSMAVLVRFSPASVGAKQAILTVLSNDPDQGTAQVKVSGFAYKVLVRGAGGGRLDQSYSRLEFGPVRTGTTATAALRIVNVTETPVRIESASNGTPRFSGQPARTLPIDLAAHDSLALDVLFQPGSVGFFSDTLRVRGPAGERLADVALHGSGVPWIALTDSLTGAPVASLNFDSVLVDSMRSRAIMVTNVGAGPATLGRISAIRDTTTFRTTLNSPLTLSAGQGIPVRFSFAPRWPGLYVDTLVVFASSPPHSIPATQVQVSGKGVQVAGGSGGVEPPAGLACWWPGDGNTQELISGTYGQAQGGVAFVAGLVNGAFSFDGVDDYVTLSGAYPRDIPTQEMWIRTTRAAQSIIDGGPTFMTWRIEIDGMGRVIYRHYRNFMNGYITLTSSSIVTDGSYHHIAAQMDQANRTIRLFVDGSLQGGYTETSDQFRGWAVAEYGDVKLGKSDTSGLSGPLYYSGMVDELSVYWRVLSPSEIASIYHAGSAGKIAGTPPVPEAGPDVTVAATSAAGAQVQLDGSGSYDPDGHPLFYNWSSRERLLWEDSTAARTKVTVPVGTHTIYLYLRDNLWSRRDSLQVTVTAPLTFTVYSPVDLLVTDPLLRTVDWNHSDIPGAAYTQADYDADGDLDDRVVIQEPVPGNYLLTVFRQSGVPDTARYTVTAERLGVVRMIVDRALVPAAQAAFTFDPSTIPPPPIGVAVSIPDTVVRYGQVFTVPVRVDSATGRGIVSAEVFVSHDYFSELLGTPTVQIGGTLLTPNWSVESHVVDGVVDTVKLAMATDRDTLSGSGALVYLRFQVADIRHPASAVLRLAHVLFNTGVPEVVTDDGSVRLVGTNGAIASMPDTVIPRQSIQVTLTEVDENRSSTAAETLAVGVRNGGQTEWLRVAETGANTGVFSGVVATVFSLTPVSGDGVVQAKAGDWVAFSFTDSLDASGNTMVRADSTRVRGGRDGRLRVTVVSQPGDTVRVRVTDGDLDTDPGTRQLRRIGAVNRRTGEREAVDLWERSTSDSVFFGALRTVPGSGRTDYDGTMAGQKGDSLQVTTVDSLTALGDTAWVWDLDKVVNPFGDADGNGQVQAYDASRVLHHRLSPYLVGLDSLTVNVDPGAPFTQITAYDAALILQKRVGRIWRFPVQEDESVNHPQPETDQSVPKPVGERLVTLQTGSGYVSVWLEEREGVISGELEVVGAAGEAVMAPELSEFLVASRATEHATKVVFAGAEPVKGPGELVRLHGIGAQQVQLAQAWLNDGQIGVRLGEGAVAGVVPMNFALHAPQPNPFNPATMVRFDLPTTGAVRLEVYDVVGQRVRVLVAGDLPAGVHQVTWDGRSEVGAPVSSGVYLCRLQAGSFTQARRMVLLK
jgi:hypothetical protein